MRLLRLVLVCLLMASPITRADVFLTGRDLGELASNASGIITFGEDFVVALSDTLELPKVAVFQGNASIGTVNWTQAWALSRCSVPQGGTVKIRDLVIRSSPLGLPIPSASPRPGNNTADFGPNFLVPQWFNMSADSVVQMSSVVLRSSCVTLRSYQEALCGARIHEPTWPAWVNGVQINDSQITFQSWSSPHVIANNVTMVCEDNTAFGGGAGAYQVPAIPCSLQWVTNPDGLRACLSSKVQAAGKKVVTVLMTNMTLADMGGWRSAIGPVQIIAGSSITIRGNAFLLTALDFVQRPALFAIAPTATLSFQHLTLLNAPPGPGIYTPLSMLPHFASWTTSLPSLPPTATPQSNITFTNCTFEVATDAMRYFQQQWAMTDPMTQISPQQINDRISASGDVSLSEILYSLLNQAYQNATSPSAPIPFTNLTAPNAWQSLYYRYLYFTGQSSRWQGVAVRSGPYRRFPNTLLPTPLGPPSSVMAITKGGTIPLTSIGYASSAQQLAGWLAMWDEDESSFDESSSSSSGGSSLASVPVPNTNLISPGSSSSSSSPQPVTHTILLVADISLLPPPPSSLNGTNSSNNTAESTTTTVAVRGYLFTPTGIVTAATSSSALSLQVPPPPLRFPINITTSLYIASFPGGRRRIIDFAGKSNAFRLVGKPSEPPPVLHLVDVILVNLPALLPLRPSSSYPLPPPGSLLACAVWPVLAGRAPQIPDSNLNLNSQAPGFQMTMTNVLLVVSPAELAFMRRYAADPLRLTTSSQVLTDSVDSSASLFRDLNGLGYRGMNVSLTSTPFAFGSSNRHLVTLPGYDDLINAYGIFNNGDSGSSDALLIAVIIVSVFSVLLLGLAAALVWTWRKRDRQLVRATDEECAHGIGGVGRHSGRSHEGLPSVMALLDQEGAGGSDSVTNSMSKDKGEIEIWSQSDEIGKGRGGIGIGDDYATHVMSSPAAAAVPSSSTFPWMMLGGGVGSRGSTPSSVSQRTSPADGYGGVYIGAGYVGGGIGGGGTQVDQAGMMITNQNGVTSNMTSYTQLTLGGAGGEGAGTSLKMMDNPVALFDTQGGGEVMDGVREGYGGMDDRYSNAISDKSTAVSDKSNALSGKGDGGRPSNEVADAGRVRDAVAAPLTTSIGDKGSEGEDRQGYSRGVPQGNPNLEVANAMYDMASSDSNAIRESSSREMIEGTAIAHTTGGVGALVVVGSVGPRTTGALGSVTSSDSLSWLNSPKWAQEAKRKAAAAAAASMAAANAAYCNDGGEGGAHPGMAGRARMSGLGLSELSGEDVRALKQELVSGGHGSGSVYRGMWRGREAFVKVLTLARLDTGTHLRLDTQLSALCKVVHPHLVRLLRYAVQPALVNPQTREACWEIMVVQEVCNDGTLATAIDQGKLFTASHSHVITDHDSPIPDNSNSTLRYDDEYSGSGSVGGSYDGSYNGGYRKPNLVELLSVAAEVASALSVLHRAGVAHGSLTAANVLMSKDKDRQVPKLSDSGFASLLPDYNHKRAARPEAQAYMAPEILCAAAQACPSTVNFSTLLPQGATRGPPITRPLISHAADVYALGVLVWEMYHGTPSWRTASATASPSPPRTPSAVAPPPPMASQGGLSMSSSSCDPDRLPSPFTVAATVAATASGDHPSPDPNAMYGKQQVPYMNESTQEPAVPVPVSIPAVDGLQFAPHCPIDLRELIESCTLQDSVQRPSAAAVAANLRGALMRAKATQSRRLITHLVRSSSGTSFHSQLNGGGDSNPTSPISDGGEGIVSRDSLSSQVCLSPTALVSMGWQRGVMPPVLVPPQLARDGGDGNEVDHARRRTSPQLPIISTPVVAPHTPLPNRRQSSAN